MIRLNKYISNNTNISRRKADTLIKKGDVTVNKERVYKPYIRIDKENDSIKLNGKLIKEQKKDYYIFYKPPGYISSRYDPKNKNNMYNLIPKQFHYLKYAGRLDKNSEGLMILSNDGDFLNYIQRPENKIEKEYVVTVESEKIPFQNIRYNKVISENIDGIKYKFKIKNVKKTSIKNNKYKIKIVLTEGKKREIRIVLKSYGFNVCKLKRIRIGNIHLGKLHPGKICKFDNKCVMLNV